MEIKSEQSSSHFFTKIAIIVAILSILLKSEMVYVFLNSDLKYERHPIEFSDYFIMTAMFLIICSLGVFADYRTKILNQKIGLALYSERIIKAKKQWEMTIDSLPQLIVALDEKANILRVNKSIENWGLGKVEDVIGMSISSFLKSLSIVPPSHSWISKIPTIWQNLTDKKEIKWKVTSNVDNKTYQYTLKKITGHDAERDQIFAVLIVNNITIQLGIENSLKDYNATLETKIRIRTKKLLDANHQLKQEIITQNLAQAELQEAQERQVSLLRDLFVTQENERKRIALELHDSIGQTLGATKFKIEGLLLNKTPLCEDNEDSQLDDLVVTLKNAIDEVRYISMNLRPPMLDDLGLMPTINWFTRNFQSTYKNISVSSEIDIEDSDIAEDNKVVIFRIIQEAFNNIAKHSSASHVVLELKESGSRKMLAISDNGIGFESKSEISSETTEPTDQKNLDSTFHHGFGLLGMRERAESIDGDFAIESTSKNGTYLVVTWP